MKILLIVLLIGMLVFSGCAGLILTPLLFVEGKEANGYTPRDQGSRR